MPTATLPRRFFRRLVSVSSIGLVLALVAAALSGTPGAAEMPARALRLLSRIAVPGGPSPATDVRWASDTTVYLSRYRDGISEVSLEPRLAVRRQIVPRLSIFKGGLTHIGTFAVSAGRVALAGGRVFASGTVEAEAGGTRVFRRQPLLIGEDVDLSGRRVALLGYPDDGVEAGGSKGALAWLGTLDEPLKDFQPLLRDVPGGGARALDSCLDEELGSVRFLPGGSLLVVPGVEPGAYLLGPAGNLVREWSSRELGLDPPGCAELSKAEVRTLKTNPERRLERVNRLRVVDDILPLAPAPGLLVRSVANGRVSWALEILRPEGVVTYSVPFASDNPFDRLRGDVRGDRVVLLRSAHLSYLSGGAESAGELIVAELPRGRS